ncbi:MAG: glycine cleavage system protein GcvH [Acidobacteria bacterium]|uniref:Glycine cleavage system H protein n=1 Tax=Candidatus Sulfomarinibacter kjeldsenii TaxID=2885994 RepID=A0A8J6XZK4_9BACT|nr:glycine cleavage system protein GcvH [Candidatus Sulfomarinibacter kjeldsenii]MBD3857102.1 glycine cleavage system protein GcvH [Candidatus Sulfomarinibacter kjeldsenii]MBD3869906.1 glycine cleavage system protein GcvH [Candidatus Sulfomarinibacter kjeldsenii]
MTIPVDLMYARSHEWIKIEGDSVSVGISHYAQDQLGEVVYVELPEVGTAFAVGDELGTLESVKAVSEFLAPVAGEVLEVNTRLEDEPNLVNDDPYGNGWLVKLSGSAEGGEFLDAAGYKEFLEQESA